MKTFQVKRRFSLFKAWDNIRSSFAFDGRRFVLYFILVTTAFSAPSAPTAASFDCTQAETEIEVAICADDNLSRLDEAISETYFSVDPEGRYAEQIREAQKRWIQHDRSLDNYDFTRQLNFLQLFNVLNSCSKGDELEFSDCETLIDQEFEKCMGKENYTTLVMNRCSSAYSQILEIVHEVESELWKLIHNYDPETVTLFEIAEVKFSEFVSADCEWQYSEYRGGTMRSQVWFGCFMGHYSKRVREINAANRFQGLDLEYINR